METYHFAVEWMVYDHGGLSLRYALGRCPCLALVWRDMHDAVDDVKVDSILRLGEDAVNERVKLPTRYTRTYRSVIEEEEAGGELFEAVHGVLRLAGSK